VRGKGLFTAFGSKGFQANIDNYNSLRNNGVHIEPTGGNSIGAKPTLLLEKKHIDEFISVLEKSLK
jgi:acetylornithine/succinyldiaminopimelate/putrescine aminotransferase